MLPPAYPDSSTQVLTYDADSNIQSRQTRAGATISYTYDTLNRLATKAAPSESAVTTSYDLAGRPVGIADNSSSIVVPSTVGAVATLTSTYDSLNNLTGSVWGPVPTQTAPSASSATFTHVYDTTNRRVSQTTTDNGYWAYPAATASTVSYTANNLDQYTAIGAVTPTYDGNGNLTFDGTFTFGYDAENRLISAVGSGNTAAYAYDAQGRRKSKTVNGTTTIFVQDPQGRALLDYDGASGAIQNWYAFGSGPNDALNQVSITGSTRATYIPDIQGSIIATLDAGSGTLTKAGYQTYGESSVTSGTFRYTGARIDAETNGLYDFRARMYSTGLGRFLQADPIGYAGGVNLYAYVNNDPLNLVDPFGYSSEIPALSAPSNSAVVPAGATAFILGTSTILPSSPTPAVSAPQDAAPFQLVNAVRAPPGGQSIEEELGLEGTFGAIGGSAPVGSRAAPVSDFLVSPSGAANLGSSLEALGGGAPTVVPTPKGASQFIFPNGTVLRFDIESGQFSPSQGPHINLQNVPGSANPNIHIPVLP